MGSFNVACFASNLSISCGTPTYLLPLTPNPYRRSLSRSWAKTTVEPGTHPAIVKNHQVGARCSVLGQDCLFEIFSLPIKGVYNDYGSIDSIEKDISTDALESFFSMKIEDIVECLTCSRTLNDSYSEIYKIFAVNKRKPGEWNIFGEDYLRKLGFHTIEKSSEVHPKLFQFRSHPYYLELTQDKDRYGYHIHQQDKIIKSCQHTQADEQLIEDFYDLTGYLLNIKDEDQVKVKLLNSLSGAFIHADIYEYLSEISAFPGLGIDYDKLVIALQEYEKIKTAGTDPFAIMTQDPLQKYNRAFNFNYGLREWPYLSQLYRKAMTAGELENEFRKFLNFSEATFSCNKFYFPAMNGEQFGNAEMHKKLLVKTIEIIDKEEKEREAYWGA